VKSREQIAIAALEAQEADLMAQLDRIRTSLRALRPPEAQEPIRPKTRADYLLEYLLMHPEGIRLKDVPRALEVQGFISRAAHETTNWLYQLPPDKRYFEIQVGLVQLRSDLVQTNENGVTVWTLPTEVTKTEGSTSVGQSFPESPTDKKTLQPRRQGQ